MGIYQYDKLNRLTRDEITSTPTALNTFTYDTNGNRTSLNTGTYAYLAATNRLTTAEDRSITLDAAGNTLSDGTRSYLHTPSGHLGQVVGVASYAYNAQRQRTRKIVGSQGTVYHYDLNGNLITETNSSGALQRDYLWADGVPLAQVEAGEVLSMLHTDHLNTPRLATNNTGAVVWRWEGKAFGETSPSGSVTVNLRFPGQYYDAETGLHYNWNRYYDPKTGRYVSSDPVGAVPGADSLPTIPQTVKRYLRSIPLNTRLALGANHLFTYVRNRPTRLIDPLGLIDLEFIRSSDTLNIWNDNGEFMFSCAAGNNVTNDSNGPWPNGIYDYDYYLPSPEVDPTGPYGSHGIFVFRVPGRTGMGVHSGRQGPSSNTLGCVRTSDPCMDTLKRLHDQTPIQSIIVH